jgi:hypothetical protein
MQKRRPPLGQILPKKAKPAPPQKTASATADATAQADDAAPARPQIKVPQILAELEEACKHIGIRLTYEALGGELGSGGLCKVKGKWRAIFDKRTTPAERVTLLMPILGRFNLDGVPLSEPVRELLLRMQPRPAPSSAEEAHAAS